MASGRIHERHLELEQTKEQASFIISMAAISVGFDRYCRWGLPIKRQALVLLYE